MRRQPTETGSVTISLGDADLLDGLGFCTRLTQAFLIPDYFFIADRGYDALRGFFSEKAIPWGDRHPVALWRGGSTGDPNLPSHRWRELPRMRLCEIARSDAAKDSIDAGIYQISQISDPIHVNEITDAGYLKPYIPPHDFQKWKYQIDIDGNSNSWPGLFMKLLTGSVVLKVASERGFRQWYYDKLKPWTNYVPVSSDLSDLVELIDWLRAHDDVAREIGRQGRLLADSLDYQGELERAGDVITAAIRCSNARCRRAGPYFVTPHEVELAYRLILGRAPENQDVVFHYVATCRDLDHLRQPFLTSKEFREQRAVSV